MSYREFNKQVQNLVVSKIFRTFAAKSSNLEIMARTRIKNPVVLTRAICHVCILHFRFVLDGIFYLRAS